MNSSTHNARTEVANFKEVKQVSNQFLLVVVTFAEIVFVVAGYLLFKS
jgi:hypothetical protein